MLQQPRSALCRIAFFGDEENLVVASRKAGETANITLQALRGNVSALIGSAYDAKWGTGFLVVFFVKDKGAPVLVPTK